MKTVQEILDWISEGLKTVSKIIELEPAGGDMFRIGQLSILEQLQQFIGEEDISTEDLVDLTDSKIQAELRACLGPGGTDQDNKHLMKVQDHLDRQEHDGVDLNDPRR